MKATIRDDLGEALVTVKLDAKTFSTGSSGYLGHCKVTIDGKRFQVQVQAVEIGSKPKG
jgi:hypothetical protein